VIALLIALVMNGVAYWNSDKIVLSMYGVTFFQIRGMTVLVLTSQTTWLIIGPSRSTMPTQNPARS